MNIIGDIINYVIFFGGTLAIYLAVLFLVIGGFILLIQWYRRRNK